jgi:adenylosuccinate lyase
MTILQEFGSFEEKIKVELEEQMPLLATTKILMECVKAGMGREVAHKLIKKHSTSAAPKNFFAALVKEKDFPLSVDQLNNSIKDPADFAGLAFEQSKAVAKMIDSMVSGKVFKVELGQLR